jgi:hypothetical protein
MRKSIVLLPAVLLALSVMGQQDKSKPPSPTTDSVKTAAPKKVGIADKVKSSKKSEGLFTMYQDTATGSIQMYVKKNQLDKDYIYQSFSINGPTSLFLNQSMHRSTFVFKIQKSFDKLEVSQVNTEFYYDKDNPISKTSGVDIPEAVILSEKIVADDADGYLINADGLFISEKLDPVKPLFPPGLPPGAVFNLGGLNVAKSKYAAVRSFPNNTDVVVDLAYDNPAPYNGGGKDITDARYIRVRMQHSLIEMPKNDYVPRRDDPRVGYFMQERNDQTSRKVVPYKDVINRWNLKKKDPNAALSEPVEPIVWWVENTTPLEYRDAIIEAGLKWNQAFEAAGFKNAVVMKIMPDTATWDPADIRYNVIRWVSSANPPYGAIGPSFVNPETGQIIGADITIEWTAGSVYPIYYDLFSAEQSQQSQMTTMGMPGNEQYCALGNELKAQFLAGITIADLDGGLSEADLMKIHKQFLTYLVLHEMGHTMGLNHNMKASQMLSPAQVNDVNLADQEGLMGSVMDYPAINVSSDRGKQGNYFTTRTGPYDIWAIQYGYTPCKPEEEDAVLGKILARSAEPQLAFGNDADDMRAPGKAIDPRVMINDMSNDMVSYGEDRLKLVNTIMAKVKDKSSDGSAYVELRARYNILNGQRNQMISAISRYIGGVYIDRSVVGQNPSSKPFTAVPLATQKKAMDVLSKYVFAPNAFAADEVLFPYLQLQRRGYNFFTTTEDPKLTTTYQFLQLSPLTHILHPVTLQRISNSRLYGNQYSVADVMNDLTKAIFSADLTGKVNVYRQYLQTGYVKMLANIVTATAAAGYDDVAKADALYSLKKIKSMLQTAASPNEDTKAHRTNLIFLVDQATTVK